MATEVMRIYGVEQEESVEMLWSEMQETILLLLITTPK